MSGETSTDDPSELDRLRVLVAEQERAIERLRRDAFPADTDAALWLAIRQAGLGRWDHDMVTGVRFWDDNQYLIFGVDRDRGVPPDAAGFLALVHPDDRAGLEAAIADALHDPAYGPFRRSYRIHRPSDGRLRWVVSFGRALFDERRCVRFVGVTQDVTDREMLEQALRRINDTLEAQVDARTRERDQMWMLSQDLMVVIDADRRVIAANPAWIGVLGYSAAQVRRGDPLALVHPAQRQILEQGVAGLLRGESLRRLGVRMRHADGTYRSLSWTATASNGLIYALGRDVTAEQEAEAVLRHTEEALRQSQKMEAVGQLTGGIAHDFNNLLTGIGGSLELLSTRIAQGRIAELSRHIEAAQMAATRAASLTHRLLAFSRRQTLDPTPTAVDRLVAGLVELIRRTTGPAIELVVKDDTRHAPWTVLVDPHQLENALLNLCINARDAMPDGGRLTIHLDNLSFDAAAADERGLPRPGDYLSLCVIDTGVGMPPDVVDRAFDPFFTTKPIGSGTGLGLSMVHGFVHQSGGAVHITSAPGEGTTLCLLLPRHLGSAPPGGAAAPGPAGTIEGRSGTVLLVDDEQSVRLLVAEVLEEAGYHVLQAAEATGALAFVRGHDAIDLLVTDVGMPGLNGRQLADAARSLRPGLRVLFITGYAENAALGAGQLDPDMQVLTKPFKLDRLVARIDGLMGRA